MIIPLIDVEPLLLLKQARLIYKVVSDEPITLDEQKELMALADVLVDSIKDVYGVITDD